MPYAWQPDAQDDTRRLLIWRYRSLTVRGFVWFMAATALLLVLPLVALTGLAVMWGLLPFALAALAGLWWAMQRHWRGGGSFEELTLSRETLLVSRHDPGRKPRHWQANPYWVRLNLRRDGPVQDYLTLTDGQREIELGVFLSPEERRQLRDELAFALGELNRR
ncbi:DUF2244 domain-containing protein [Paracoccus alkenifer]|uniref:Uncharacterized membrane protein n=1 Tax=Paracoccus alkenifer TaxID=65735 RepID=A0A1H6L9P2_9RHOB|nr:DUF2244 domain-containing protein [Paracoccus alkenifer]SEH85233.1 Uncharacterized membrane protein [Paracoccus alkenifer]